MYFLGGIFLYSVIFGFLFVCFLVGSRGIRTPNLVFTGVCGVATLPITLLKLPEFDVIKLTIYML